MSDRLQQLRGLMQTMAGDQFVRATNDAHDRLQQK
jgi:hypothetical protein